MLGYITVGTNNKEKAAAFYDALLGEIGEKRIMDTDAFICWGKDMNSTGFCITKPYDGNPASVGNGTMHAFMVDSPEAVDTMHSKALELGATDEGAPGYRDENKTFYGAYFRDLDGHKMNFFYYNMNS